MKNFLPWLTLVSLLLALLPCPAQDATNTAPASPAPAATAPSGPVSDTPFSPGQTPFPDGTRWAAVGDSITHGGYYKFFLSFYYWSHFPKQSLTMYNCGWNGAAAWQCIKRYPFDILPLHPTVATIMFGMNDGGRDFYLPNAKFTEPIPKLKQRAIDSYEKNLKALVDRFIQDKIPPIIILPSIYDDSSTIPNMNIPGYNAALAEMARRALKVAQEENVPWVDFYDALNEINKKQQAIDPKFTIIGTDRTHPGPIGHLIMAYTFLKAQHVPGVVATFNLKGTDGSITGTNNCTIDQVQAGSGGITFRYSANALPFPVERWYTQPLQWVPFSKDVDNETFQVTDLPAGNYDIQIDGQTIRTATADELAAGVQMAEEGKTPEYQQAFKAWRAYAALFDTYARLRDIVTQEDQLFPVTTPRPLTLDQDKAALDALVKTKTDPAAAAQVQKKFAVLLEWKPKEADANAQIDATIAQVRAMLQPQPHTVKIAPSTAAAAPAAP